jgi:hypothetical protein
VKNIRNCKASGKILHLHGLQIGEEGDASVKAGNLSLIEPNAFKRLLVLTA